ncbi:MAG: cell division protein ZapA [Rhodobacteraceae bacterium]|nr:cell division protein ZapA [Paracoccaceae bacterium]
MPDIRINVGGRDFDVACQDGEEHFLKSAAAMLDVEASVLTGQIANLTEGRLLLMAGLMLADKTAGMEDSLKIAEGKLAEVQAELETLKSSPQEVEVPIIPDAVTDTLAEIAARAEAMAAKVEEKAAS